MDKVFTSKALMDSDLGKIIEEETNLQFTYKIDPVADPNAAVLTVQLDRNNPIYANFLHQHIDNDELLRAKSLLGNTIEGLIDYQKAKVGGVFAKVKNTMWLTVGLVQSKMLTDEEVAAVICHEIGHTFTIFSQIASLVSLNYIVDDLSKRLLGTSDKKVQINILHEYDSKYGIKLPEEELLATVDNKQKFVTKVVTDVVKNSRNSEGDYVFSLRNCEMAADQFAARMGAGRAIVTGLNKMYAAWGQDQYHSKTIHYMIQAFQIMLNSTMIAAGLFIAPMFSVIFVFAMVVARPQEKVYDDPMERFTRVRNEYIVALKRLDISREMKKVYLDDIKSMDNVISALNKNVGWLEWVWDNWIPSGKRTKAAMDYQQLIERMGNNDLFMKSASYELLIEDLKNA
jgi:Zn-dependent protease with chaperone function